MSTINLISFVIPTYNGKELLAKNLPILFRVLENTSVPFEVIVVDDGSSDDTLEYVSSAFPQVNLITLEDNSGFRAAVERGVESSEGDLVFLLNNDVEVCEGFLDPLLEHFDDDNVFQVAPISLLDDRETIGEGPKWAYMERGLVRFEKLHSEVAFPKTVTETIFVSGGQTLIRKDRYLELDGLDDLYDPFYWEDVDLSYRAWKRGWKSLVEPRSVVVHPRGQTINQNQTIESRALQTVKDRNRLSGSG